MKLPGRTPLGNHYCLALLVIASTLGALYGQFLSNPLVFDDYSYFGENIDDDLKSKGGWGLRGISIASFGWVIAALGGDLVWQRLFNLTLHIANAWLLFVFLVRLFEATLPQQDQSRVLDAAKPKPTALPWLAAFGALWFALNPAAVYGVAYLAQRTIVMATLFSLVTWLLFLEGLRRDQRRWLLASAVTYLLAVLSKEHAITTPAISLALLVLMRKFDRQWLTKVWPTFLLYGLVGTFTFIQIKSGGIVGNAYEPNALTMLTELGIDPKQAHALSVLTQSYLYFKYLIFWIVPNTNWMSVDMLERFARNFLVWPETLGLLAFAIYPALAVYLLWQRGRIGLMGLAMLGPWLMFATEISTIRIQEPFVIYRSYLWMPCLAISLPFLFQKVPARYAFILMMAVVVALVPLSWNRLVTFSDNFLLWDDALRLIPGKDKDSRIGRMYHNRGLTLLAKERYPEALRDFDVALTYMPKHSYIYNHRASVYLNTKRYWEALDDYDTAIWLNPNYYNPYLGRAATHEALGNHAAARLDYARSCRLGVEEVCRLGY